MKISFTLEGEKQISRNLRGLKNKDLRKAFQKAGRKLVPFYKNAVFSSEGSVIGERWKGGPAYHGLIRTGSMRNDFHYETTKYSLTLYNDTEYFRFHQSNKPRKSNLPRRVMFKLDEPRRQIVIYRRFTKTVIMIQLMERIHELLQNGLPKNLIKQYYIGPPDFANDLLMPCLSTRVTDLKIGLGPTGFDNDVYTIEMRMWFAKKRGVQKEHTKGEKTMYREMMDTVGGLNDSGNYMVRSARSVLGILRSHIFLSGDTRNTSSNEFVFNTDLDVQFIDEGAQRTYNEVVFTFTAQQIVQTTSRI